MLLGPPTCGCWMFFRHVHHERTMLPSSIREMWTISMAVNWGLDVLFCIPSRTKCIVLVSVMFSACYAGAE
jgi:hypothetical protein